MCFAVKSKHCNHESLPKTMVFETFAQAVESYLEL